MTPFGIPALSGLLTSSGSPELATPYVTSLTDTPSIAQQNFDPSGFVPQLTGPSTYAEAGITSRTNAPTVKAILRIGLSSISG